jgi:serine/threonine-protein kinase
LREAADWRERSKRVEGSITESKTELEEANKRANAKDVASLDLPKLRVVFETLGAARAKAEAQLRHHEFQLSHAAEREKLAADLRKQIEELRKQLQRYSDALENDLAAGRERIGTRVKEALTFEKRFDEVSTLLLNHVRDKPECRELIEELVTGERDRNQQRRTQTNVAKTPAEPNGTWPERAQGTGGGA